VPEERIDDVVLLDPSDEEYAIGFNALVAHSDGERALLASDLVAVFRRLSTACGDQLNSVLSNALLAFMESERGGTLFDVRRFLMSPSFVPNFVIGVDDVEVEMTSLPCFEIAADGHRIGRASSPRRT
jgi:hypothetical protein